MPVIFTHKDSVREILLWKIEESIDFFKQYLSTELQYLPSQVHSRNLQWLASRYLLTILIPETIHQKNELNKPILIDDPRYISLSHVDGYTAAMVSTHPCGIDIELDQNRIQKIAKKFITTDELKTIDSDQYQTRLYQVWCSKEAMYKAYGLGEIDFKNQLWIDLEALNQNQSKYNGILFKTEDQIIFHLNYHFINNQIHLVYGEI